MVLNWSNLPTRGWRQCLETAFLVTRREVPYWHGVCRGQGCCEIAYNAQDSPWDKELSSPKYQYCWGWRTISPANGWTQKQLGTNWHHLASSQRGQGMSLARFWNYSCKSGDSVFILANLQKLNICNFTNELPFPAFIMLNNKSLVPPINKKEFWHPVC